MIKVKIWYRKERKKWCGRYFQHGKPHTKSFGSRKEARQWKTYMAYKLNLEDWQSIRGVDWHTATRLFLESRKLHVAKSTLTELTNSLVMFEQLISPLRSDLINQGHIDGFMVKRRDVCNRKEQASNRTINKDLSNLRTFINWLKNEHLNRGEIKFEFLSQPKEPFIPPSKEQWDDLFRLAKPHPPLHLRMVLAFATGFRRGAVEQLCLSDTGPRVDIDNKLAIAFETKTKKWQVKPLGEKAMKYLFEYINDWLQPTNDKRLFPDRWDGRTRKLWEKIRREVGLPKLTFHNMRNMGASDIVDKGESAVLAKEHLGHKDLQTTMGYIGIRDEKLQLAAKILDDRLPDF